MLHRHFIRGVILVVVFHRCCFAIENDETMSLPFARQGEFVFLPVQMEGRSLTFIFDTGASHYVFDSSLVSLLGKTIKTTKTQSGVKIVLYEPPDTFNIGRLKIPVPSPVIGHDLSHVERLTGSIDGIIGVDLVVDGISQFDFKERVFRQFRSNADRVNWGVSIPLNQKRRALWIETEVGGERLSCKLDTGSSTEINVTRNHFDSLVESNRIMNVHSSPGLTFGGDRTNRYGVLDSISLGEIEIRNVRVGEFFVNTIGIGFLSRFKTVTIDGPSSRIYLQPSPETNGLRYSNLTGIRVLWSGTQILIHSLAEDSPGSRVGLQVGDVLVKVNGKTLNVGQLRLLLRSKPGRTIELLVLRNGVSITYRIDLLEQKDW